MSSSTGQHLGVTAVGPTGRFLPPGLVLLGAIVVGLAGTVGVVRATDVGVATSVPAAVWVVALPGVVALLLALLRPTLGAAFAAGAGGIALVRVLTDVFVVVSPDQVARPEFYFPGTREVHSIGTSVLGATLLVVGDLLMVAGGVWGLRAADGAIRGRLTVPTRPRPEEGVQQEGVPPGAADPGGQSGANIPLTAVGLLGLAAAFVLGIGTPYRGGYLDDFYSLPADLGSTLGPFLLAVLSVATVIRAAGYPRGMATALLGGTATMFAVPGLTALAAVAGGARTEVGAASQWVPLGLAVMVAAGLLSTLRWSSTGSDVEAATSPPDADAGGGEGADRASGPIGLVGAGLGVLAGVAALVAPLWGFLRVDGAAPGADSLAVLRSDPIRGAGVQSLISVPVLVAGIVLVVVSLGLLGATLVHREAAVLTLRSVSAFVVLVPLTALAAPVSTLAQLSSGQTRTATAIAGGAPADFTVDTWGSGPGMWSLVAAVVLAVASATCALVAVHRRAEQVTQVPDDDVGTAVGAVRTAAVALVLVLSVLSLSTAPWHVDEGSASTVLGGNGAWTCWLLLVACVVAAGVLAASSTPAVVLGAAVGAAILLAARLVVPSGVGAAPGFRLSWGFWVSAIAVVAVLAVGVVLARRLSELHRSGAGMGSAPHVDNRSKPISAR